MLYIALEYCSILAAASSYEFWRLPLLYATQVFQICVFVKNAYVIIGPEVYIKNKEKQPIFRPNTTIEIYIGI